LPDGKLSGQHDISPGPLYSPHPVKAKRHVHPAGRVAALLLALASASAMIAQIRPHFRTTQAIIMICAGFITPFLIIYSAVRSRPPTFGAALASFLFTMVILLTSFADIYQMTGLVIDTTTKPDPRPITTRQDAAYFSVVTWTTLGYGDLQPKGFCRIVAATEALIGNIYLGSLIALLFLFLTTVRDKHKA
jgi:hypothetical protein